MVQDSSGVARGKSIPDAMAELSISRPTIYRLLSAGQLKAVKIGSKTLITSESLDAYWRGLQPATFRAPKAA